MTLPDRQRLTHIRDYCEQVAKTIDRYGASFEVFDRDIDFQQSVAFCVLQIGALTGKLSQEYRDTTKSDIPWKLIRGMRNLVVHDYGSIDRRRLWVTAVNDLPTLKQFCDQQLITQDQE